MLYIALFDAVVLHYGHYSGSPKLAITQFMIDSILKKMSMDGYSKDEVISKRMSMNIHRIRQYPEERQWHRHMRFWSMNLMENPNK